MACTQPRKAWKYGLHESGKQKLVFKDPGVDVPVQEVPCGKCESCKLDYSREWATRVFHEMQVRSLGCFLTLTISPEHMVRESFVYKGETYPPYSVYKRSVQLFLKRLRKAISVVRINPETGREKRYYQEFKYIACGEYGDGRKRPHYHLCIMGYDFPDKVFWKFSNSGEELYRSPLLEELWEYGYSSLGNVTWQTAAYVARYCFKKSKKLGDYEFVDTDTGEVTNVLPEFLMMSKGVGKSWWLRYESDTDKDYLVVDRDKKVKVPRYYDKLREAKDPEGMAEIKAERERKALERQDDNINGRAVVKRAQVDMLKRGYESES